MLSLDELTALVFGGLFVPVNDSKACLLLLAWLGSLPALWVGLVVLGLYLRRVQLLFSLARLTTHCDYIQSSMGHRLQFVLTSNSRCFMSVYVGSDL